MGGAVVRRVHMEGAMSAHAACPDCPAARLGVLGPLLARAPACAFEVAALAAHAPAPASWGERYALGLVRRGVLIRQRRVAATPVAIDAAGPGCAFPVEAAPSDRATDYAATDVLVCLLPRSAMDRALERPELARDLFGLMQASLDRVERLTAARGAQGVRERVSSLLCVLSDTLSPPRQRERLPADLQQRDLARLVGVRHETFCRVLGELEREGAVQRATDGLVIVDRLLLERAAA